MKRGLGVQSPDLLQLVVYVSEIALGSQGLHFLKFYFGDIFGEPGRVATGVFPQLISVHGLIEINYMAIVLAIRVILL